MKFTYIKLGPGLYEVYAGATMYGFVRKSTSKWQVRRMHHVWEWPAVFDTRHDAARYLYES